MSSVTIPRRSRTSNSAAPKSSPTGPTGRTSVKKLAAREKCTAAPPSIRSRSPNGVLTASNAIDPTTVSDMARTVSVGSTRCGGAPRAPDPPPFDYLSMTAFKDLGLAPEIQQALDELGFEEPTPIQEQAIPELLGGHDVIGQAQTGTGKTAAFGLPLLQYLDPSSDEVQAIVLTPTRELCIQVTQALRSYAEHLDVDIVAVFGGAPIRSQQAQLRAGGQVVVATVGRMMDLMSRRSLVLTAARYVVLDEADEMLDLGFIEDVEKILRMCPSGRQTALFSATMPPPIQRLAEGYMYDPTTIRITPKKLTVDAIEQA